MNTTNVAVVNGISLQVVADGSEQLVAVKPVCEILGVDFSAQRAFPVVLFDHYYDFACLAADIGQQGFGVLASRQGCEGREDKKYLFHD